MDPSGMKGGGNNRKNRSRRDESQTELRLRQLRASEGRTLRSTSNNTNAVRPEEAPSSMSNNRRRSSNDPPAAQESNARFAARPNRNEEEEEEGGNNNNDNPLLADLLRHLREYCRDGDRKGAHASAINVEKARNVLEACAGNVALAGQLYWDDYFASQMHEQPLDAPSGAAAAAAPAEEENNPEEEEPQGVRRRLESDFERLLPAARLDAPQKLPSKRRRRRRQQRQEAGEPPANVAVAAANNNNNNNGNIPLEDGPAARLRRAPPPPQPENNIIHNRAAVAVAAEDAAGGGEASVSVSDDEAGVGGLRMVRARNGAATAKNRSRRRRRSSSEENNSSELNRAREVLYAQINAANGEEESERRKRYRAAVKSGSGDGDGGDDDDSSGSDKDESDDDAYLSENDWLFNAPSRNNAAMPPDASSSSASQPVQNLRAPLKILWGGLIRTPAATAKKVNIKMEEDDPEEPAEKKMQNSSKVKVENDERNKSGDGSADDNDNNNANDGDEEAAANNNLSSKRPEIPSTWLHASFSTHPSAMGLAIKKPKVEDVAEHSWKLQQLGPDPSAANRRSNAVPLPYHCRSMTAVLSIVTAIIYTGASIQSNQVTCSTRVPFLELSEEERTRQFDDRLVDALAVLIFIAAKASKERKKKALDKQLARKKRKKKRQKRKEAGDDGGLVMEDDEPDALQQTLERKLKLCPVAWWKENPQGVVNLPSEQWQSSLDDTSHTGPRIQVGVSYSNLGDIGAYVLSNLQSFLAPGGLALFLETIVGIHGEGAVKRMIEKSRKNATDSCKGKFLVKCSCEERQRKRLQDASERRKLMSSVDTTPPGNDCISIELISLLLTGKVQSSWKGWSTDQLGFGILSRTSGEVGQSLNCPELPVWLLAGETCFSLLALDHTNHGENLDEERVSKSSLDEPGKKKEKKSKQYLGPSKPKAAPCMKMSLCSNTSRSRDRQEVQNFSKTDQPGAIVNLLHWNCWFAVRNQSGLRLITDRPKWSPPTPSWVLAHYKSAPNAKHSSSLSCVRKSAAEQLQERRSALVNVVSCDERDRSSQAPKVDEGAMERVRSNDDDVKFYPGQYRMWRFDMGKENEEIDPNSKPRGDHWVPYFSLSRDDQSIVEMKFGPQINRILWTRWPSATIDKFTPAGKTEALPVV
ncbi:expressed unknown protein [Seminavis robusta]|uniref:Uncharacterized protein n=1 Tax=Seminavis robusta TaxID=568900 RepID=A0A9N8ET25_9STRA|nr:expressed unknown protein [Seminavis robusta]|eukprot:Sro1507_g278410.1 n/a (1152) ;mRNA; r:22493-26033